VNKKPATWNPLSSVGRSVDKLLDTPALTSAKSVEKKVGRPRREDRKRIVLYLGAAQVEKLKITAIKQDTDASTIVRRVLSEAGF
jgi:hypothetical protein